MRSSTEAVCIISSFLNVFSLPKLYSVAISSWWHVKIYWPNQRFEVRQQTSILMQKRAPIFCLFMILLRYLHLLICLIPPPLISIICSKFSRITIFRVTIVFPFIVFSCHRFFFVSPSFLFFLHWFPHSIYLVVHLTDQYFLETFSVFPTVLCNSSGKVFSL